MRWLVSAAEAGYGRADLNGLGWRLPDEFGACVAGDLERDVLNLYCATQEAAWLKNATGFTVHGRNIRFLFGEVSFLLPMPAAIPAAEVKRVTIYENSFPFNVSKNLEFVVADQIDAALIGPLFFFHPR